MYPPSSMATWLPYGAQVQKFIEAFYKRFRQRPRTNEEREQNVSIFLCLSSPLVERATASKRPCRLSKILFICRFTRFIICMSLSFVFFWTINCNWIIFCSLSRRYSDHFDRLTERYYRCVDTAASLSFGLAKNYRLDVPHLALVHGKHATSPRQAHGHFSDALLNAVGRKLKLSRSTATTWVEDLYKGPLWNQNEIIMKSPYLGFLCSSFETGISNSVRL